MMGAILELERQINGCHGKRCNADLGMQAVSHAETRACQAKKIQATGELNIRKISINQETFVRKQN